MNNRKNAKPENTVNEGMLGRLIKFRSTYVSETQRGACTALGISQTTLSKMESGDRPINLDTIEKFVLKYKLSADWLITGEGSPIIGEKPKNRLITDISALTGQINLLKRYIKIMEVRHSDLAGTVERLQTGLNQ